MLKCKHPSNTSRNRPCGNKATYIVKESPEFPVCEEHAHFYSKVKKIVPKTY
jgi:hypothetical protein